MRVTLEWDRTLPSLTGTIDRDDGYKIEWSADGNAPWTSLVNYTNQHGTFDIWCVCYPTRFNDDTIAPGTTRHYRIKAVDDDDESPWSDVVSVTTPALVESDQGEFEFGAVVSTLDSFTDQKVFRFDLDANESYRFRISGGARVIVTGPFSTEVMNEVLEPNNGLKPRFTTQAEGEYQVKISHGGNLSAGRFHFILVPESEPGLSELTFGPGEGPDDVVLNTYGDTDRFGLRVQPGRAYQVRVWGREDHLGLTAATPHISRAHDPSSGYTDHNMAKPWVDGVTNSEICAEHGQSSRDCEEFQAFVIDLRGQTGAQQTWHIDVSPTARPGTRPYRVGTYGVRLRELSSSELAGVRMPLRAWFASQPAQHDGSTRIKVRVAFSDAIDESPQNIGEHGVSVDGGEVTSVRPVDGQATGGSAERKGARSAGGQDEGPQDREVVWELEIEPDSDEDVTVSLAAWRPCDETGAICTADGRTLSAAISTTVRGPDGVAAPAPPDKPRGLEATATHGQVMLTWDDPGDDSITGYVILRRNRDTDRKGEFRELVADTGTATTTYTDDTVAAETRYTYRIKAINGAGTSERSRWFHIDTPAAPAPEPANSPATGDPTISGTAQVGETLTADTSDIADADGLTNATFSYQWLADGAEIVGATSLTYTLADTEEGRAIKVRVSFADDAGNEESMTSAATNAVAAEPSEPPSKPTGLDAAASHDSVTLTWNDPQDESITGYVILRRVRENDQGGDFSVLVANTGSAATTYTDNEVAASTTYTYRIKAINGAGTSERSRWVHIDTPAPPVPDKPTGLEATASNGQVVLTWDDPDDDSITGYVILRRLPGVDAEGHFDELVANTGTAATTYTDDSVAAETRYTYRIKAINEHGTSERSRWYHIDTPAAP